jgi:hypothetical protein
VNRVSPPGLALSVLNANQGGTLQKYIDIYQSMVSRGICAHAAAVSTFNYVMMQGKDEGLTLEQACARAKKVLRAIKDIWEA